ncbi:MAG: hypothetical protein A3C06_01705 [Candidatus Taylorbacteria bacterium RIFCSPHIGHO2_02_FULL_46_13]|uniref:Uncharacterized protein n=1 Tax=Candidatus Taylorbacteria bacterium RIFCSPHIGHO2_02_FULL_46_13 TaxID=1802312 RepID=A0A1G2MR97_9BACT|nr:MAG: hypothetical protein A3C06_01705 [Candidatus Taylorbacteria bacterium RIFCSPHIGHO2_02_FULL_46_13]
MQLTEVDHEQVRTARAANALVPVEKHRIQNPAGTILVPCPDGDQFRDVYGQHCRLCNIERHHPLSLNGGALLLSKHSPVRHAKLKGSALLLDIKETQGLKGMDTLALYVHAPCGVAYGTSLDFFEVMRLLIEAKLRLLAQRTLAKLKIVCFCHVDYPSATSEVRKRTYFVNRAKTTEFLAANGREVRV